MASFHSLCSSYLECKLLVSWSFVHLAFPHYIYCLLPQKKKKKEGSNVLGEGKKKQKHYGSQSKEERDKTTRKVFAFTLWSAAIECPSTFVHHFLTNADVPRAANRYVSPMTLRPDHSLQVSHWWPDSPCRFSLTCLATSPRDPSPLAAFDHYPASKPSFVDSNLTILLVKLGNCWKSLPEGDCWIERSVLNDGYW